MSQLVCPLCGRFVSLRNFDPSGFDSDIYAVNVVGLGRGRGFAVSESFSILGNPAVTGPIAERCRRILSFIERGRVLFGPESNALFSEVERLKGEVDRSIDRSAPTFMLRTYTHDIDIIVRKRFIEIRDVWQIHIGGESSVQIVPILGDVWFIRHADKAAPVVCCKEKGVILLMGPESRYQ